MVKKIDSPYNEFVENSKKENIPIMGLFELTFRCNLRCRHCYNNDFESQPLSTGKIKNILDQLASAGTMFITLTGGEIFTRKDIFDILEYANRKKFIIKLLTNGTLIDEEKAKRLVRYNILSVDMSIYGPYASMHDNITRIKGSFERFIKAVRFLRKNKIRVYLNTCLFKNNFIAYSEIKKLADKLDAISTASHMISPKRNGDKSNKHMGICPTRFPEYFSEIYKERLPLFAKENSMPSEETLGQFVCKAAHTTFAINPYGKLFPCLLAPCSAGDLLTRSFKDLWNNSDVLRQWRDIKRKDIPVCNECKFLLKCPVCPADQFIQNKRLGPIKDLCNISNVLYKASINKRRM